MHGIPFTGDFERDAAAFRASESRADDAEWEAPLSMDSKENYTFLKRAAPAVVNLRTEHTVNPVGIDVIQPRLSWQIESSERGTMQSAYQIQVAATEADLSAGGDLVWDSGRIVSDESVHIEYGGPEPESRQRYVWRVRIWDQDEEPSSWSSPAFWEMGLLRVSDWQASWIEPGFDEDTSVPQPSPMLRKTFEITGDLRTARLYITSHGVYEAYLNGRRVGDRILTPGWTSYHERLQYQTYDVADLLKDGTNVIGAVLGDGWYRGFIGFEGNRNEYGERLGLLAQLHVTYDDGSSEVVVRTGEGWKASTGPIRMSDLYIGETYDARLEKPGWSTAGYDASAWSDVRLADHGKDVLVASSSPPVRKIQTLSPIRSFTTPEGDLVFDMGQNMVGWVRLRVEGPAGSEVTLRHAEVLASDGNFYTENLRAADQTVTYILKGDGVEVFEPHFTFQGFRYVAVDGYPGEPTPDDLTGVVIHSDMDPTGHFESSNALVNQLQHNIVWGQKGNFVDIPTDCPQRDERLGWTGDAQVFAPTATFNMDVESFFEKWLRDLAADQEPDGSIPYVVPDVLHAGGATGWADAGVIVPWTLYQRYGNVRVLERQYESMKAWVEYMREQAAKDRGTLVWDTGFHFGDWLAYSTDNPAYPGATTNTDLIATAYFAHSTELLAKTAELLGKSRDAREDRQLHEDIQQAFVEEFVTARGRISSDTQTAYVLALSFDLLPPDLNAEAADRLAEEVRSRGHLTTGFLGTPELTHTLSRTGHTDAAYKLLLRTDYPSWLYPVTMGATTIWERWDGIKPDGTFQSPGMNSYNHYAYGAIGDWLYGVVAGLRAAAPGYKELLIAPRPGGGLTHARARLQSLYGPVESSWELDQDEFRLAVTVPPNTRSTVRLPNADLVDVTETGRGLESVEGVENVRQDEDDVVFELGSGRYAFTYPSGGFEEIGGREVFDAATPLRTLLESDSARAVLERHATGILDGEVEDLDVSLREFARFRSDLLPRDRFDAMVRELRELDVDVIPSYSAETKLAELLASREARRILADRLPALMDSPWLSQAMGFSLSRVSDVIPIELSAAALDDADGRLRRLAP